MRMTMVGHFVSLTVTDLKQITKRYRTHRPSDATTRVLRVLCADHLNILPHCAATNAVIMVYVCVIAVHF
jgi:hypothetical protein